MSKFSIMESVIIIGCGCVMSSANLSLHKRLRMLKINVAIGSK